MLTPYRPPFIKSFFILTFQLYLRSRDSAVAIGTRLRAGRSNFWIRAEAEDLSLFPKHLDRLWDPPSPLFNEYRRAFQRVKWLGYEVNHSPISNTEVKNEWIYIATPPIRINCLDRESCFYFPVDSLSVNLSVISTSPFVEAHAC
jgi:hypothetical protein